MKMVTMGIAVLTGLLILSVAICGFWIKANKVTDPSSISFHVNLGTVSVVFVLISLVMLGSAALKQ